MTDELWRWVSSSPFRGYFKCLLFYFWNVDAYLLKYSQGSHVTPHRDQIINYRHYRLHIVLQKPIDGGEFKCSKVILNWFNMVILFRADSWLHETAPVNKGTKYVLSIGFYVFDPRVR